MNAKMVKPDKLTQSTQAEQTIRKGRGAGVEVRRMYEVVLAVTASELWLREVIRCAAARRA